MTSQNTPTPNVDRLDRISEEMEKRRVQPSPARSDMLDAERVLSYSKWSAEFIVKHRRAPTAKEAWGFLAAQATPADRAPASDYAHPTGAEVAATAKRLAERAPSGEHGNTDHVGRDMDGIAQPFAGAIVLLETIAECGATAFIDGQRTPNSELCTRFANELRTEARRATAGTTAAPTCSGCDPAEGFCKVCREAERATAGNATPTDEIVNWLRRNANAEKDPAKRAVLVEAHNAARKIAAGNTATAAPGYPNP